MRELSLRRPFIYPGTKLIFSAGELTGYARRKLSRNFGTKSKMQFQKKLTHNASSQIRKGLRRATIRTMGYDRKVKRAVLDYFDLLSRRHQIPVYQIRILIPEPEEGNPKARLWLGAHYKGELPTENLIKLFWGEALGLIPGIQRKFEVQVTKYLGNLRTRFEVKDIQKVFLRIMVLAGAPVVMAGVDEKIEEEIPVLELIEWFT